MSSPFGDQSVEKEKGNFILNPDSALEPQEEPKKSEGELDDQQAQDQQEPGEPANDDQAPEGKKEPGKVQQSQQQDEDKLAGKFKSREDLINGLDNLGQKLGKGSVDKNSVSGLSDQQLVEIYKETETELGQTSDTDKTRRENQRLKEELDRTQDQINQLTAYVKNLTMQQRQTLGQPAQNPGSLPRDPNTGRFVSPQQQEQNFNQQPQQGQQQTQPQGQSQQQAPGPQQAQQDMEDLNPDQVISDFYKDPVNTILKVSKLDQERQKQVYNNMSDQQQKQFMQTAQKIQNNPQQYQQQVQGQMQGQQNNFQQFQQAQQGINQQTQQNQQNQQNVDPAQKMKIERQKMAQQNNQMLRQKAQEFARDKGDELNDEIKKEMGKVIKEKPVYQYQAMFPDGSNIQHIYEIAKQRIARRNVDNNSQDNQDQMVAQKQAAAINSSNKRPNMDQQSPDDQVKSQIKNVFKSGGGVFS